MIHSPLPGLTIAYLDTLPQGKFALIGCLTAGSHVFNPACSTHVFDSLEEAHIWWRERHGDIGGYSIFHRDDSGEWVEVFS